ncbi:MAG: hypothetical protein ACI9P7_002339, partial [Candidatus Azotimanducaceae bacterium]
MDKSFPAYSGKDPYVFVTFGWVIFFTGGGYSLHG